jgi:hypothetical protein
MPSSASDRSKRASEASTSPSGELWDEVGGFPARSAASGASHQRRGIGPRGPTSR